MIDNQYIESIVNQIVQHYPIVRLNESNTENDLYYPIFEMKSNTECIKLYLDVSRLRDDRYIHLFDNDYNYSLNLKIDGSGGLYVGLFNQSKCFYTNMFELNINVMNVLEYNDGDLDMVVLKRQWQLNNIINE